MVVGIFIVLSISKLGISDCAFGSSPAHFPPRKYANPIPPKVYPGVNDPCPYYTGKPVCCDELTQSQLKDDFTRIDFVFGNDCPICAVNMKRLWCEFDCNPLQSDFIETLDYKTIVVNKVSYNVLEMDWYIHPDTVCHFLMIVAEKFQK